MKANEVLLNVHKTGLLETDFMLGNATSVSFNLEKICVCAIVFIVDRGEGLAN